MEFSHELALMLLNSSEPFPVDIEQAWRWIGYSTKQKAKNKLANNFEERIDYTITQMVKRVEGNRGGGSVQFESIRLTVDCFKSLGMMAGTQKGKEIRRYFLECERIAKQAVEIIPAQAAEIKRLELELQVLQAKQRYQDSAQGIIASTSLAMLAYLRGDGPPPVQIQYRERFIDAATGREIGSSSGHSLTQLITDAGLNPKSTRDAAKGGLPVRARNQVKKILKCYGFDYDRMQNWSTASYLREYPVLTDDVYDRAMNVVLKEVLAEGLKPNLFIHQMQQATLGAGTSTQLFEGVEP